MDNINFMQDANNLVSISINGVQQAEFESENRQQKEIDYVDGDVLSLEAIAGIMLVYKIEFECSPCPGNFCFFLLQY